MIISIDKCISEIEFRFPDIATHPSTSKEWQTLKDYMSDSIRVTAHCPFCVPMHKDAIVTNERKFKFKKDYFYST